MKFKKKALTAIAGAALIATATPTLIASTALVTVGTTKAEASCYGYGSSVFCSDGSSYSTYGNSTYGYNSYTGQTWGSSTYGNTSYGYSYGTDGSGTNWSYSYYGGYGRCVIINHGKGYKTMYAHLSRIYVVKDEYVNDHHIIGRVGSTGHSTGAHLHYEIFKNEKSIDPEKFIWVRF